MVTQRFVTIGRIRKSFGVAGEVLVEFVDGICPDELIGVEVWAVPPPLKWRAGRITQVLDQGDLTKVAIEGLNNLEDAKPLAQTALVVDREDLAEATLQSIEEASARNDASLTRQTGYQVSDERYGDLGTITDTLITGSNDVWVVEGRYGEVLIPVIDDVVGTIDDSSQTIKVALMKGLIDRDPIAVEADAEPVS
ncbi:MAG: ribosome maturation factor RimM [Actinomycetia bacterium]|nr:ribosome maturation factor RimM [Actinomycetes bacterium]